MEQRITSLLLPAPEAELEASCKELDEKVTWLLHNSRKMDNYLELEPFSKDGRLCAHVCDTLKSLPETPTLAAYSSLPHDRLQMLRGEYRLLFRRLQVFL